VGNSQIPWVIGLPIPIVVLLAIIPSYHETISNLTAELDDKWKFLLRFFLDPTKYVWKRIVLAVLGAIALFIRGR